MQGAGHQACKIANTLDKNHTGYTALKLLPPRHRPVPIQPPCTHSVSLTCTYSICACIHGVLSLQDWSNGDLSLDLQCPMPNTIMTAHSKGAPCPTPAPPYPHPAFMLPQPITYMFMNGLVMRAGGVVSARLEQWRPVAGPPLPNAQHIGDGLASTGRSLPYPGAVLTSPGLHKHPTSTSYIP